MTPMEPATINMPVLALRGLTVFPHMNLTFDVERPISIAALERAMEQDQYVFLVAQRETATGRPEEKDLYAVGTLSVIRQILRIGDSAVRVMMEGRSRARLRRLWQTEPYLQGNVEPLREGRARISEFQLEALLRQTCGNFAEYASLAPRLGEEVAAAVMDIRDPGRLADFIAQNIALRYQDKQSVLEELRPLPRLRKVNELLAREAEVLSFEQELEGQIRRELGEVQRDHIIREQIRLLQQELGEDEDTELTEYRMKIDALKLTEEAREAMARSRALAEKIAREGRVAYGITTGFGDFQKVAVPEEMSNQLSTNLILSHCTGTGEPYSQEQVRGMMLLRANALCVGLSGVRPVLVEMLIEMLNRNVIPVIPQKGSLGASGDLAPLSHMGLVLLGRGEAFYQGQRLPGGEAMEKAGIPVLDTLVCKEGLGMTNGTCAMTSVGSLALYDTICAAQLGDIIGSMDFEGLTGLRTAFDPRIHQVRGQKGQMLVAANMRKLLEGSEILDNCQTDRVQDAYALRCIPQVHGAVRDALEFIKSRVDIELNAVTDNPLLFCEDEAVISGGNFHGEPMALPFDFLGIACAELASISERRIERMVNASLSNGLTRFLTIHGGVNSGFMIVQYTAASMASENKVLAHPACVDSIPSSANQEDFVSMGTTAARKAGTILQNTLSVLALELLTACQAVDIRRRVNSHGTGISPVHEALYQRVRQDVAFYDVDREIWPDVRAVEKLVRSGELLEIAEEKVPALA